MELLMSICLLASPANCHDEHIAMSQQQVPPMACMVDAQQAIAQWQQGHPKWHVAKWRCLPSDRLTTSI